MATSQTPDTLHRILDYSSRADPFPLYAELRKTPVALQEDGSYVISTWVSAAASTCASAARWPDWRPKPH
ncbi:hypothetical protein ACFRCI_38925 [Streptomyces sp. NPDC056638]|uniref:hypothetical protein n=1 Tax=Streptomyces sp. NPDC056638 TaxID=3345887 RepID=UPI003679D103